MPEQETNDVTAGHVDDLIELFALGVLERDAADLVTAHAATCGRCAQQVGIAEATVVALAEATAVVVAPPHELGTRIGSSVRTTLARAPMRRNSFVAYAALAATLIFAVGTGFEVRAIFDMRRAAAQNDVALVALVNSHFTHQTFEKVVPAAPTAKILLGRNPHWLYVIVESRACGCHVFATTASGVRDLGQPVPHERTSTLFVPDVADVLEVDLREGARVLATVRFISSGKGAR